MVVTPISKRLKTCSKCHRPFYANYKGQYYCPMHLAERLAEETNEQRENWLVHILCQDLRGFPLHGLGVVILHGERGARLWKDHGDDCPV